MSNKNVYKNIFESTIDDLKNEGYLSKKVHYDITNILDVIDALHNQEKNKPYISKEDIVPNLFQSIHLFRRDIIPPGAMRIENFIKLENLTMKYLLDHGYLKEIIASNASNNISSLSNYIGQPENIEYFLKILERDYPQELYRPTDHRFIENSNALLNVIDKQYGLNIANHYNQPMRIMDYIPPEKAQKLNKELNLGLTEQQIDSIDNVSYILNEVYKICKETEETEYDKYDINKCFYKKIDDIWMNYDIKLNYYIDDFLIGKEKILRRWTEYKMGLEEENPSSSTLNLSIPIALGLAIGIGVKWFIGEDK